MIANSLERERMTVAQQHYYDSLLDRDGVVYCRDLYDGLVCTCKKGHEQPHVAHGNVALLVWWDLDPDLEVDEGL